MLSKTLARKTGALWATAGALLGLILFAGCGSSAPSPIELVPREATMVATVNMAAILDDPDVRELYESTAAEDPERPATLEELLEESTVETGIDLSQFSEVIFFGKTEDDEDYTGFIVRGDLDGDALTVAFREGSESDTTTSDYRGHAVTSSTGPDAASMAVLDGRVLVAGSPEAVGGVIDVYEGDSPALSGAILDTFDSLGDPWVKVAATLPESEDLEEIEGMEGMPVNLQALTGFSTMRFAFDKDGETFEGQVVLGYGDEAAAAEAREVLDAMLTLMVAMMPGGDAQRLFDQTEITVEGSDLHIVMTATTEDLRGLDVPEMLP